MGGDSRSQCKLLGTDPFPMAETTAGAPLAKSSKRVVIELGGSEEIAHIAHLKKGKLDGIRSPRPRSPGNMLAMVLERSPYNPYT